MKKSIVLSLGFVGLCALSSGQQNYAFRNTDIRAAFLHLPGDHIAGSGPFVFTGAPHVLFNLDSNRETKPAGWNFYNPLAPGVLTQQLFDRYGPAGMNVPSTPPVNTPLNKRTMAYWFTNVADLSNEDITQLDFAVLQISRPNLQIRPEDRERLRKFVDQGGVLWVDYTHGWADPINGLPIGFQTSTYGYNVGASIRWDYTAPLLRYPNTLTDEEIRTVANGAQLVSPVSALYQSKGITPPSIGTAIVNLIGNVGFGGDYNKMKEVAGAGGSVTLNYTRIGNGYMVVTTSGLSELLNYVQGNQNRAFYAIEPGGVSGRPNASTAASNAISKLVYNMIYLASESSQSGSGSRRNYGSFIDVGAPLIQAWSSGSGPTPWFVYNAPASPVQQTHVYRPPVIYKGMVFVSANDRVNVYDADPRSDIDGDGNPDDGIPDLSLGEERDLIFTTASAGVQISSPVVTEVPRGTATGGLDPFPGTPVDQLLVTTADGRLLIYRIFDPITRRLPNSLSVAPIRDFSAAGGGGSGIADPNQIINPPTVFEGVAYVTDTVNNAGTEAGRIFQVDLWRLDRVVSPTTGQPAIYGGTLAPVQKFSGPPAIGYIPIQDNSGGLDRVAYLGLQPQQTPQQNAGLISLWLGAKGERPASVGESGGNLVISTRAAASNGLPIFVLPNNSHPLNPKITLIRTNGVPYTQSEMASLFTGSLAQSQGQLTIGLSGAWPPPDIDPENGIRVDYTIDWGAAGTGINAAIERGRLNFPGTAQRLAVDGVSLSPNGAVYLTYTSRARASAPINNDTVGGSLLAFQEEGRGLFRMVNRWDIFGQHQYSTNGGTITQPNALPDNDPVQYLNVGGTSLTTVLGGNFTRATFQGAPVIRNGEVFVTVSGIKSASLVQPVTSAILCFRDSVEAKEIVLRRLANGGGNSDSGNLSQQANFTLLQPDLLRSASRLSPTTFSTLPPGQFTVEQEPGGLGAVIRINNLMNTQRGQIVDSFSTSQPIILRTQGGQDRVIDPDANGSRWSNLKWYTIIHGTDVLSSAWATGNTLYVAGNSLTRWALEDPTVLPPQFNGAIFAIRTDFDPSVARRTNSSVTVPLPGETTAQLFARFEPVEVVADANRPYMRQVISMDYPRLANSWTSTQAALNFIVPNQLYQMPQTPQNKSERGAISFDDYRIRFNQTALQGTTATEDTTPLGIVGGEGTILSWTPNRIHGFRKINTWVADQGRVALFDPAGNVLFDSSRTISYGPNGAINSGGLVGKISKPTRVVTIPGTSDIIVVESEKSRLIRLSSSGRVSREITGFQTDPNFVPRGFKTGETLFLQNPRDAVTYTSEVIAGSNPFSSPAPLEQWVHYLVADQGNGRIVEIVDRYALDPNTGEVSQTLAQGQLLWHSPAEISGPTFGYNSISRVQVGPSRFLVVAGVSGKSLTRSDTGEPGSVPFSLSDLDPNVSRNANSGNGSIVLFDSSLTGGYRVFDRFSTPEIRFDRQWDFATNTWSADPNRTIQARTRPILNLQSVTASMSQLATVPQLNIMIADASGVFEVTTPLANPTTLTTRWMLPDFAYVSMRRFGSSAPSADSALKFFPTYARRLDDENVIIVNGYQGRTIRNSFQAFNGEVLQVDGRIDTTVSGPVPPTTRPNGYSVFAANLGFNSRSIRFSLGPVEGSRGLVLPVFADRR